MSVETPMIWRFKWLGQRDGERVSRVYEVKQPGPLVLEWEQQADNFHVLLAFGGLKVGGVERIGDSWIGWLIGSHEDSGGVPTMEEAKRLTYDMAVTAIEADRDLFIWRTGESWEERLERFHGVGR